MICDHRALNKIKIPDTSPIQLINETTDKVVRARVFSQTDLESKYHQMRLKKEDFYGTAICTIYVSFEWRVLHFGLNNETAAFSLLLSHILHELHGECMVLYLDNILI